MGNNSVIGSIHGKGITHLPAGLAQAFTETTGETRVDIDRKKVVVDRYPFESLRQCPQQGETVFPSGQTHRNPIPVMNQVVTVNRFPYQAINCFVYVTALGHNRSIFRFEALLL